jgi:hypothetical protein
MGYSFVNLLYFPCRHFISGRSWSTSVDCMQYQNLMTEPKLRPLLPLSNCHCGCLLTSRCQLVIAVSKYLDSDHGQTIIRFSLWVQQAGSHRICSSSIHLLVWCGRILAMRDTRVRCSVSTLMFLTANLLNSSESQDVADGSENL